MAPDTDLLRDIGIIALGIIVLFLPLNNAIVPLIAYLFIGFGVVHTLFRINLNKSTERKK